MFQPADANQIYFLENLFNLYIEGLTDFIIQYTESCISRYTLGRCIPWKNQNVPPLDFLGSCYSVQLTHQKLQTTSLE